jgi:hypothetical protein
MIGNAPRSRRHCPPASPLRWRICWKSRASDRRQLRRSSKSSTDTSQRSKQSVSLCLRSDHLAGDQRPFSHSRTENADETFLDPSGVQSRSIGLIACIVVGHDWSEWRGDSPPSFCYSGPRGALGLASANRYECYIGERDGCLQPGREQRNRGESLCSQHASSFCLLR